MENSLKLNFKQILSSDICKIIALQLLAGTQFDTRLGQSSPIITEQDIDENRASWTSQFNKCVANGTRDPFALAVKVTAAESNHEQDQILGTVFAISTGRADNKIARIEALAVHPDFMRRGVGAQLLDYAGTELARRGAKRLELFASSTNYSLHQFYQSQGWYRNNGVYEGIAVDPNLVFYTKAVPFTAP